MARTSSTGHAPWPGSPPRQQRDDLRAATGLVHAVLLSVPFWVLLAAWWLG